MKLTYDHANAPQWLAILWSHPRDESLGRMDTDQAVGRHFCRSSVTLRSAVAVAAGSGMACVPPCDIFCARAVCIGCTWIPVVRGPRSDPGRTRRRPSANKINEGYYIVLLLKLSMYHGIPRSGSWIFKPHAAINTCDAPTLNNPEPKSKTNDN